MTTRNKKPIKLAFVHYNFGQDGVTRVVLNNLRGLRDNSTAYEATLVGGGFSVPESSLYSKQRIQGLATKRQPRTEAELKTESEKLLKGLRRGLKDYDRIVIENPTIGLFPIQTFAYKMLADSDSRVVYRVHDTVEDKPLSLAYLKEMATDYRNLVYPGDTKHLVVNPFSLENIKGLVNVPLHLLVNSVVASDFEQPDEEHIERFRQRLIRDRHLKKGEEVMLYGVRVVGRKNVEEAMILNGARRVLGTDSKLIVTMRETRSKFQKEVDYGNELNEVVRETGTSDWLGGINKAYGFFQANKPESMGDFELRDLFGLADLTVTTSVLEGFGFAYVEPFIASKPLVGRAIPHNLGFFESVGLDLSNLYGQLTVDGKDFGTLSQERRIETVRHMNDKRLKKIIRENGLETVLAPQPKRVITQNRRAVMRNFSHTKVAKRLIELIA
jgi:hypothetical protein